MKKEQQEVTDPETNEVRTETILIPTGEFKTVVFEVDSKDLLEAKCIELLNTYNKTEFMAVNTEPYEMDLVWGTPAE